MLRIHCGRSSRANRSGRWDDDAAMSYGLVRASLSRRGKPIGPLDTLIASHARVLSAIVVTHNTREFSQVENLKVEDWVKGA